MKLINKFYKTKKYKIFSRISDKNHKHTIILVHGLGISSAYMVPLAEKLATKYNIHAIDLPGFGNSQKPFKMLQMKDFSDSVIDYMESINKEKVILLGNSFGCQVITDLAHRYPQKAQALMLIGPTVNPKEKSFFKQLIALIKDSKNEPEWQRKLAIKDHKKAGNLRIACPRVFEQKSKIIYYRYLTQEPYNSSYVQENIHHYKSCFRPRRSSLIIYK